jgi:predicted DNA-binding transcriptional regulator AlpA
MAKRPVELPADLDPWISRRQLSAASNLSTVTLWRLERKGELERPTRLSPGRVGWKLSYVKNWLATRGQPGTQEAAAS